jgi:hypothetical protein
VATVKVVGPNDVITNHGIEHGDHLAHDRNDHDLRHLASALEAHSHLRNPSLLMRARAHAIAPFSTVDPFGTPHSKALHVIERYRLIDGEAAAEAQRKHAGSDGAWSPGRDYGRGIIDPDTTKKGLQVEFTVEDPGVFTTPWSGRVTYRRVIGDWPEAICADNPFFLGSDAAMPTAHMPDF